MNWENQYLTEETPWDKGAPAPPLLEWIEKNPNTLGGSILVPGCGSGHDVRSLASKTDSEHIVGLDISPTAVKQAMSIEPVGGESYLVADLFNLPQEQREAYDWVWEHTCFCAIDPELRDQYVEAVHGALKPDGHLLAVFYLNPYDNEHPRGEGPPHGTSEEELRERFEQSGKFTILESYVPQKAYPGREGLELTVKMQRRGT